MTDNAPLTSLSHGAGCGCKLAAAELRLALESMTVPIPSRSEVLVDFATADDAALYDLGRGTSLVQSLDFFTPVVDDPRDWGRIAAANALSDIYAMGGDPVTALNIVAWPREGLGWDVLGKVLDGGAEVLTRARCALVGGHSIDDTEPKYGLSVTGLVDTSKAMTNAAGQPGDVLVLTKPLGVGIATTAAKTGQAGRTLERESIELMVTLNDVARAAALEVGCRCATDVTGFGLVGHLGEVARSSHVMATMDAAAIPVLEGVRELIAKGGCVPGGTERNLAGAEHVDWGGSPPWLRIVACDAQTSGGMLLAIPPAEVGRFHHANERRGGSRAVEIGILGPVDPDRPGISIKFD